VQNEPSKRAANRVSKKIATALAGNPSEKGRWKSGTSHKIAQMRPDESSVLAAEQNPSSVFPDPTPRVRWQRNFKSLCSTVRFVRRRVDPRSRQLDKCETDLADIAWRFVVTQPLERALGGYGGTPGLVEQAFGALPFAAAENASACKLAFLSWCPALIYDSCAGGPGRILTLWPSARSTGGLRITWSLSLTPALTSTVVPKSRTRVMGRMRATPSSTTAT
jgi:hypothetical protein